MLPTALLTLAERLGGDGAGKEEGRKGWGIEQKAKKKEKHISVSIPGKKPIPHPSNLHIFEFSSYT